MLVLRIIRIKKLYLTLKRERNYYKNFKIIAKTVKKKIKTVNFSGLTINFCKKINSNILIRGLRVVADFEYEFQLAGMNNNLNKNVQTIFLMADIQNQAISSNMVKEIAYLGGDVAKFVPKPVLLLLKKI